jgi:hypothetical protein
MITGRQDVEPDQALPRPVRGFGRFGLLSAVAIAAAAVLAITGAGEGSLSVVPASAAVAAPVAQPPLPAASAPAW